MDEFNIEQRQHKRKRLIYYLKVLNNNDNNLIGNLVDITPAGMMIISEEPIKTTDKLSLKIVLPRKIMDKDFIEVDAKCLWSKNGINPVLFDSGFQFTSLEKTDREIIENISAYLTFED